MFWFSRKVAVSDDAQLLNFEASSGPQQMLTMLEERLSLQAVAPRPGGGDGHGVLLWYSGFVRRAGYGLSLEAGAVVKDSINKYIVVGNC